jgi:arginase family enzyme
MPSVSILGIPHDANSSFMRGPAEAPALIRPELMSDAYSLWTETGVNLGVPGGTEVPLELRTPVYLSLDIDALDPAFAPGVSHREPGGLSTRQVIDFIHRIDQPIVAADVVEYNPRCDISNQTALVAAKLVKEIAGVMLARR